MKSIGIFINTLSASGGTQRILTTLANMMVQDFKVSIMVTNHEDPFFELDSRVNLIYLESKWKFSLLRIAKLNRLIYKELNNICCDYYISLDSNSVLYQSLFLPKNTKLIVWEHFSLSKNSNKWLYRISRYYASKRAFYFVLLSLQEVRDWMKHYNIHENRIKHIYNPITVNSINILDEHELYSNKRVLAIGNNINIKGFDYLIRAWSLINTNYWKLEIVGLSDNEQKKLRKLISKYNFKNEIVIRGKTNNIGQRYLDSSIYCLTSRKEATPLVLIESQFFGLPAVIFDNCAGALELLNDNSALVVPYNNVELFAESINRLIESRSLYSKLSKNAKQNSKRFDPESFYSSWREILS